MVPLEHLDQWLISGDRIADFIAGELGQHRVPSTQIGLMRWEVGLLKGKRNSSHLVLLVDSEFKLSIAGHSLSLAEVIVCGASTISLDTKWLHRLLDSPATGGGDVESTGRRRDRLQIRVDELRAKGVKGFLKTCAAEEDISIPRLKQILDKKQATAWEATPESSPSSRSTGSSRTLGK